MSLNLQEIEYLIEVYGRSPQGSVSLNTLGSDITEVENGRSPQGSVSLNCNEGRCRRIHYESLPTGEREFKSILSRTRGINILSLPTGEREFKSTAENYPASEWSRSPQGSVSLNNDIGHYDLHCM